MVIIIPHQNTTERLSTEPRDLNQNKHLLESSMDMMYPMMITIKTVAGIGNQQIIIFLI